MATIEPRPAPGDPVFLPAAVMGVLIDPQGKVTLAMAVRDAPAETLATWGLEYGDTLAPGPALNVTVEFVPPADLSYR